MNPNVENKNHELGEVYGLQTCRTDVCKLPHELMDDNPVRESKPSTELVPDDVLEVIDTLLQPSQTQEFVDLSDSDEDESIACSIRGCNSRKNVKCRSSMINSLYNLSSHENPLCDKCFERGLHCFYSLTSFEMDKFKFPYASEKEDMSVITIDAEEKDNSGFLDNDEATEWCKDVKENITAIDNKFDITKKHKDAMHKIDEAANNISDRCSDIMKALTTMDKELVDAIQDLYNASYLLKDEGVEDLGVHDPDRISDPNSQNLPRKPVGLPPRGKLERKKPLIGQEVYVVKVSEFLEWVPAVVEQIFIKEVDDGKLAYRYKVKIQCATGTNVAGTFTKEISDEQIAYKNPPPVRLIIGQRVISLYKSTQANARSRFYSGVVAEVPNLVNSYRYLIFFDNGNVQYSNHEDLRVTVASKEHPHEYFPQSSQQFIREYFERLPERKIVNVNTMDVVKIELKGKWMDARVTAVDASLMEVYYPKPQLKEWLYRGSSRMLSMTDYMSKSQFFRSTNFNSGTSSAVRAASTAMARRKRVLISNIIEDDSEDIVIPVQTLPLPPSRGVAKKSVTKSCIEVSGDNSNKRSTHRNEYSGFLQTVLLPPDALLPKNLGKHQCNPECIKWTNYDYSKTRGVNPLLIPMLFGYRRVDQHQMGSQVRQVYYQAPCGILISDYEDLLSYNKLTQSLIPVDMFNFDCWVKIYDEFVSPADCIIIKDMAEGKEHHPIPVVNCLDVILPPYMAYITNRKATNGVPLNLDPEFLCGCDCVDDCRDQANCACFLRTLNDYYELLVPTQLANLDKAAIMESIGYKNRRLHDNVPSGIYECNSRCKCCKVTCLNRVVQQPMSVKLELFKTKLKGWGTRCLNDIPAGGFICVYVGKILNENEANEDGRKHGDEYFAELDYIEYMEQLKEGYENSPRDPERDSDDSSESKRDRYCTFDQDSSDDEANMQTKSFGNQISPEEKKKYTPHRLFYGKDEQVYVIDAKITGNIGRYFNHSCEPNIFVQNVFIDTHDLRFPWVAFFARRHIRAGTELTWDYQYNIGSVPGKEMYCHCQSSNCRGRLL